MSDFEVKPQEPPKRRGRKPSFDPAPLLEKITIPGQWYVIGQFELKKAATHKQYASKNFPEYQFRASDFPNEGYSQLYARKLD